jgi:hypothetical protein
VNPSIVFKEHSVGIPAGGVCQEKSSAGEFSFGRVATWRRAYFPVKDNPYFVLGFYFDLIDRILPCAEFAFSDHEGFQN